MLCSEWPRSKGYQCVGYEDWVILDGTMMAYKKKGCENLCRRQRKHGCCYISSYSGCYFRPGANSSVDASSIGNAITCYNSGT